MKLYKSGLAALVAASLGASAVIPAAQASSHREAPFITEMPKVDGSDFYMFNSYEAGREGFVTLIANYLPLQDAYGGPNYFSMDTDAAYEIRIDNDGDAEEDISFRFRFATELKDVALDIAGKSVSVPLINVGQIGPGAGDTANLNVLETYTLEVRRDDDEHDEWSMVVEAGTNKRELRKPVDNIGNKSIPDYAAYANAHIHDINIPGCGPGRVFAGQRREGFVVNLGETFDLVNTNPLGPVDGEANTLDDKNVTSLALEVPAACLTDDDSVIAAWTVALKRRNQKLSKNPSFDHPAKQEGKWIQVSRLGNPLVNEVVIGIKDKDRFNASEPEDDAQFADYVTHPTLPTLLEVLFGVRAPSLYPRADLVAAFLTGVEGLNKTDAVAEMLRLNTAIPAVDAAAQNNLGVIGGDLAGFPNGRRPGDDVVDIALRAVMGVLLDASVAPDGQLPYTDGAYVDAAMFDSRFPYLLTPLPGSPD